MYDPKHLISAFDNTTNSYKFYWWIAILELIKNGNAYSVKFEDIAVIIFSKVWYPISYYKLSFGKQDQLARLCKELAEHYKIREDIPERELFQFLDQNKTDKFFTNLTQKIVKYVPYRFIRPWFNNESRGITDSKVNKFIVENQHSKKDLLPYTIEEGSIQINPHLSNWVRCNFELISSFTNFRLFNYIEQKNKNTPSLLLKMFKPETRKLSAPTKLWKQYLNENPGLPSIFDKNDMVPSTAFSIDHFLPWSFCTHDLLWNLHPISRSMNSSKSNCLPDTNYLPEFSLLQYDFTRYLLLNSENRNLEDYYSNFRIDRPKLELWNKTTFENKMTDLYLPMFEIAENMGFSAGWKYASQ